MTSPSPKSKASLDCFVANGSETLFSGMTTDVVLPGVAGIVEVLPGHAECFVALGKGEVVIAVGKEQEEAFETTGGVAHVRNDRVVVLL